MQKYGLIITPPRLGDTIFALPGLQWLIHCTPKIHWHVLTLSKLSAEVFKNHPVLKTVLIAENKQRRFLWKKEKQLCLPKDFSWQNYETVVCVDFGINNLPELQKLQNTTWKIAPLPLEKIHRAQHILQWVEDFCGKKAPVEAYQYRLFNTATDDVFVQQKLQNAHLEPQQKLVVFHLGCHGLKKRHWGLKKRFTHRKTWPIESWQELAAKLQMYDRNIRFALTGTMEEKNLGELFIQKFPNTIDLIAQINIQQLVSLFNTAQLFVTGDTGPQHVACASNVPLIALFGPTDPQETGPFPLTSTRRFISKQDLAEISAEEVFHVAKELMAL